MSNNWDKTIGLIKRENVRKAYERISIKYTSMSDFRKRTYLIEGIVALIAVFAVIYIVLTPAVANALGNLSTNDKLSIVNGIATATLAAVATLNMIESRKVRSEVVRPRLALEPTYFEYDKKTGELVGFTCLTLVNGGSIARDVEIDISCNGKTSFLYNSSIGTNSRVQIWSGEYEDLGGNIVVAVKYKNIYNKSLQEVLSINIGSLISAKRKFVPVQDLTRR